MFKVGEKEFDDIAQAHEAAVMSGESLMVGNLVVACTCQGTFFTVWKGFYEFDVQKFILAT